MDNFYTNFQEYPEVFNYKETENMLEKFNETGKPSSQPQQPQQPSQPIIKLQNQNVEKVYTKGPGLTKSPAGISIGMIFGIIIIVLSSLGVFNLDSDDSSLVLRIIFFVLFSAILLFITVTILYSINKLKNNPNKFNCSVIRTPENEKTKINNNNTSLYSVKDLGLSVDILHKLNIRDNYPVCDNKTSYLSNDSGLTFLYITMALPVIVFLITGFGLFKGGSTFFENSFVKFGILGLFLFMMIALIISIGSIISSNKLTFECDHLNSFQNMISNIDNKDNRLTTDEKNFVNIQLSKLKLNQSAIVCYEPGSLLKKNSITRSSIDGFVLFTYIITISLILSLFIIIVKQSDFDTLIFDLTDDTGKKILYLFILFFIITVIFAGIIYPSAMNDDKKNKNELAGGLSVPIALVIVLIPTIITTIMS